MIDLSRYFAVFRVAKYFRFSKPHFAGVGVYASSMVPDHDKIIEVICNHPQRFLTILNIRFMKSTGEP